MPAFEPLFYRRSLPERLGSWLLGRQGATDWPLHSSVACCLGWLPLGSSCVASEGPAEDDLQPTRVEDHPAWVVVCLLLQDVEKALHDLTKSRDLSQYIL